MLRDRLRLAFRASPLLRPLRRARVARAARSDGHFDWGPVIARDRALWDEARRAAASGKRVLVATDVGLHFGASRFDSLLAAALTLRDAHVDVLLCDGALPACMIGDISWYPDPRRFAERGPQADFCAHCFAPAAEAWGRLGFVPKKLGAAITADDRRRATEWADGFGGDIAAIRADPIADQALAGALRFFARSQLPPDPAARSVLRSFLVAARLAYGAARKIITAGGYDVVILHHGIYVPQGPVLAAAREEGARVVSWNVGYRQRSFVVSHDDSYHHTMLDEPVERWENLSLSPAQEGELDRYLESRRRGDRDWIVFGKGTDFDAKAYLERRGIDLARPVTLALTNVAWDAQLHYPSNSFASMADWLIETVRWFAGHPDAQLVIRVHPAELSGSMPANERSADILAAAFPSLPANVVLVAPDDPISTYALIDIAAVSIVYATKAGIEVAASGKPLIVAGDAWARGKGFSIDAADPAGYRAILDQLPVIMPPSPEETARAKRYAFHYFFRRMIPVGVTQPAEGWPPFQIAVGSLADLAPGADPGLDVICGGILAGTEFEYPAERLL